MIWTRRASLAFASAPLALFALFWFFMRHPVGAGYVVAFDLALLVPFALAVFQVGRELGRLARLPEE